MGKTADWARRWTRRLRRPSWKEKERSPESVELGRERTMGRKKNRRLQKGHGSTRECRKARSPAAYQASSKKERGKYEKNGPSHGVKTGRVLQTGKRTSRERVDKRCGRGQGGTEGRRLEGG